MLDAGALARFGRVEVEPGSAGYELLTRTGNVEQPRAAGWSDWQPLKDGAVASPAGPLPAVEGRAAREWHAGQRGRELSARQRRSGGGRTGGGARRARQSAEPAQSSQPQTVSIAFPSLQPEQRILRRRLQPAPCRPSRIAPPSPSAGPRTTTTATT